MYTRLIQLKHGPSILVRPLRGGDVESVRAVFEQLGESSRRARFNGPKPCLSPAELEEMARVDGSHYVLVAYLEADPRPIGIARLVRTDRATAEIAFAIADSQQHHGIGSALAAELVADARAAGITEITAFAGSDNRAALALVRRVADVRQVEFDGPELSIRAAIA
jgi:ribosomal protein S18 acetylase RimI-like enzyme